jgi:hypothetical protein
VLFQEGGKKFSVDCWTHDIEKLVKLAGLATVRDTEIAANAILGANWLIVNEWTEESRYQMKAQPEAVRLYSAIADNANGVMQWIRVRW